MEGRKDRGTERGTEGCRDRRTEGQKEGQKDRRTPPPPKPPPILTRSAASLMGHTLMFNASQNTKLSLLPPSTDSALATRTWGGP